MFDFEGLRRKNPAYFDFLVGWQEVIFWLIMASLALGVIIYLLYKVKYWSLKSYKQKYDYVVNNEINRLWLMHLSFDAGLFFFVNHVEFQTVAVDPVWFIVRFAIAGAIAILYGYVTRLLLKYYWPGPMHKKLRRLRYSSRINPATGNKMKLLSEAEEDAYLDEGKQAEESVFSVDYDVWIDTETNETHIEKYDGRLNAEECDRCGFQTLKLQKEEVVKPATDDEDGELLKEFKCAYCARVKRRTVKLSKNFRQDAATAQLVDDPLERREHIVAVKIDISSDTYSLLSYEFQTIKEALKSSDLQGEGYGIRSIKVELYTSEDMQLKFEFQNLPETRHFLEQFALHNVNK